MERKLKQNKNKKNIIKRYEDLLSTNKSIKIDLKWVKKNFDIDKFLERIEKYNFGYPDEGDMFDRIIQYGIESTISLDYVNMLSNLLNEDDKFKEKFLSYDILSLITNNFSLLKNVLIEDQNVPSPGRDLYFSLLFSKKNKVYYIFTDDFDYEIGQQTNRLFYKSKNKKSSIKEFNEFEKKLAKPKTVN